MTEATKKKTSKKAVKTYTATVTAMGKDYIGKGKTATEAINAVDMPSLKVMSILTVSNGKEEREKILPPIATHRLFASHGLHREIALKNIGLLFDNL